MAKKPSTERVRRYRQTHKLKQIEIPYTLHETLKLQSQVLGITIPALIQMYIGMFHEIHADNSSLSRMRYMKRII